MMKNNKQHHSKDELRKARRNLVLLLIALAIGLWLASCTTTKYVPMPVVSHDTIYQTKEVRDSIHVHDSILIKTQGDTVLVEKWHTQWRDRWRTDTLRIWKVDSIPYPQEIIKEVPADPSWGQRTLMNLGWAMLAVIAAGIIWLIIKIKSPL